MQFSEQVYEQLKDKKVFIALPQHELARFTAFELHLENVIKPPMTTIMRLCGIYIASLQNAMVRTFLQSDFEWFWLLNDDQPYPQDTLLRLLSHNKDIVVPLCLMKSAPHAPLIYDKPGKNDVTPPHHFLRRGERGLIPIYASGGGGMLVHRRVFEAIPDPWWTVHGKMDDKGIWGQTSEDFDFCDRVAEAGFQLYCDLDCSVLHIALYGIRAMVDQTGEWRTVLCREEEKVVLPAAAPPESPIQIAQQLPLTRKDNRHAERILDRNHFVAR